MQIQNWEEITMDSETFAQVRENFDMLLQRLVSEDANRIIRMREASV